MEEEKKINNPYFNTVKHLLHCSLEHMSTSKDHDDIMMFYYEKWVLKQLLMLNVLNLFSSSSSLNFILLALTNKLQD